jgi:glycerol-3-phosphate acyltransferase PlsY
VAVGIIDCAKGALAVLAAQRLNLTQLEILMAVTAVVLGHNFPVFLKFRGGRGVSTAIGVFFVVIPQAMLIMKAPTVITLLLTKNVSKAMIVLFVPLSGLGWWLNYPGIIIGFSLFLPGLVALTHLFRAIHVRARLNP